MTTLRDKTAAKRERTAAKAPWTLATAGAAGLGSVLLLFVFRHLGIDISIALGIAFMTGLAYSNGANDVSKAIATLVGSGVRHYRPAIFYGSFSRLVWGFVFMLWSGCLLNTLFLVLPAASRTLS